MDTGDGSFKLVFWGGVVGVREDVDTIGLFTSLGSEGIDNSDGFKRIEAKLETISPFPAGGKEVDRVTHDTEVAAFEGEVVAMILHGNEIFDEVLLAEGIGTLGRNIDDRMGEVEVSVFLGVMNSVVQKVGLAFAADDFPDAVLFN